MSLLSLLTVGNSFTSVEDHPSRYRMSRQNLLPHFGGEERDFEAAATVPASPAPMASAPPAAAREEAPDLFPSGRPAASLPAPAVPAPAVPKPARPVPVYPSGRWTVRPRFGLGGTARARTAAEPVQRELPWEDIPVARNDLNEADVEVVAQRRPAPAAAAPGMVPPAAPAGPARVSRVSGGLWARLRARFRREARS